jgi:signal transduction histidine kinase
MTRTSTPSWEALGQIPPHLAPVRNLSATLAEPLVPAPAPALDAHELIHDVLRENARTIASRRLKVSVRLLARNHYFVGDRERHRQMMQNLLRCAIASTPTGGHITVRSTRPADCALRIEVEERSPWLRSRRP